LREVKELLSTVNRVVNEDVTLTAGIVYVVHINVSAGVVINIIIVIICIAAIILLVVVVVIVAIVIIIVIIVVIIVIVNVISG